MERGTKIKSVIALVIFVFLPSAVEAAQTADANAKMNQALAGEQAKQLAVEAGNLIASLDPSKVSAGLKMMRNDVPEALEKSGQREGTIVASFVNALLTQEKFARGGFDANAFASKLLSGELESDADAFKMMGLTTLKISEDEEDQADQIYADKVADSTLEEEPEPVKKKVVMGQLSPGEVIDIKKLPLDWSGNMLQANTQPEAAPMEKPSGYSAQQLRELTILVAPKATRNESLVNQISVVKKQLSGLGVKMLRTRENIFEIARHNFREFKGWRDTSSLMAEREVR